MKVVNILSLLVIMSTYLYSFYNLNMFLMWFLLEINTVFFLYYLFMKNEVSIGDSFINYFLIQSLASVMFLISVLGNDWNLIYLWSSLKFLSMILIVSMMLKMGAYPFFSWVVSVSSGCLFFSMFLLLVPQKMIPFLIITKVDFIWAMILVGVLGVLVPSILQLTNFCFKLIMLMSSFTHMGWMVISLAINSVLLFLYYMFYFLINLFLFFDLKNFLVKKGIFLSGFVSLILPVTMISLSGIPPFTGFIPKWIVVNWMVFQNVSFFMFSIVFSMTCLNFFIYNQFVYSAFLMGANSSFFSGFNYSIGWLTLPFSLILPLIFFI